MCGIVRREACIIERGLLYEWARAAFSDAELAAARSEPDGCGIDEVLARLGG
jgi:hypothetical protein